MNDEQGMSNIEGVGALPAKRAANCEIAGFVNDI
jgi:hypothetical protein